MFSIFAALLKCDMQQAFRGRSDWVMPLFFFMVVISLFPLAISSDALFLQKMAPGIIWIALLLSVLMGSGHLFHADFKNGTLEDLLLSPYPLTWLVLPKIVAHWGMTGWPLTLLSPIAGLFFHLPVKALGYLGLSLLLGTPTLSVMTAMGQALTIGVRNASVLMILLVVPLFVPVLIFGTSVVPTVLQGGSASSALAWLGAFLLGSVSVLIWVISGILRWSVYEG